MSDLVWTPVKIKLGQIRQWKNNPRYSTKKDAANLVKSLKDFGQPEAFSVSPFDGNMVDLYNGHQRTLSWMASKGADFEVWAMQSNRPLTEREKEKLTIFLHTGAVGRWNWDALSGWSAADLREWGMDNDTLAGWNNDALNLRMLTTAEIDEAAAFSALPDQDRAPFQQMTFTLHDEQAETIREALKLSKGMGEFTDSPNENSNGNALSRICELFITEHGNG